MENWAGFRYHHLFQIWHSWVAETQWHQLDRWLRRFYQNQKSYGKKDRMAYSNAFFSAMRMLQLVDVLETGYTKGLDRDWIEWDVDWNPDRIKNIPAERFWYWVALKSDINVVAPNELVDDMERKDWFINNVLNQDIRIETGIDSFWYGWRPLWNDDLTNRAELSQWTDEQKQTFIQGQNRLPPVWLRPQKNTQVDKLKQQLTHEGVDTDLQHGRITASGGVGLLETSPFKSGLFEIQDYASQKIAETVAVKPGQKVWDACAGAGGKSLAIAEVMNNKGIVVATDIRTFKLDELKRRAKKGEYYNIRTFGWDAEAPLRLPKEVSNQSGFDWVLIDAPCSSTGTWRRNPDARWRESAKPNSELLELQQHITQQASQSVRLDGHLVYATCSWMVEENEQQVSNFLRNNPGFKLISQTMLGFPEVDSDAMFSAVLQRIE